MNLKSLCLRASIVALLICLCTPLQAGILNTYSNRSAWEAATTGRTDIDFSALGLATGGYTSYSTSSGLTLGGVTFTGYDTNNNAYFLYALNPASGWDENFGTGTLLKGPMWYQSGGVSTTYVQLVLPAAVTSFGIDLGTITPQGANIRVEVDGVYTGTPVGTSLSSLTFFGFSADSPVNQLRFHIDSGSLTVTQALIDNVSFGQLLSGGSGGSGGGVPPGAETPETATLLYVATGACLIAWRRKSRLQTA